ncbi:hypothetical protein [Mycobacterium sp. DL592]|uniref:hypothetical protein n=1 Tax=Mycobacterium sp. DL592 TaxID=2675524 RepID=UPI001422581A|nr:hypothetical protein [Mycobacterium sp. DL592]
MKTERGRVSWQEHVKHALEWTNLYLQTPLGAVGFGFAFYQIHQARTQITQAEKQIDLATTAAQNAETAADAAKDAAEGARGQFKAMSVAVLLPQLRSLEEMAEHAIRNKAKDLAIHLLQDWRWHASTCREYLDENVKAEAEVMAKIQKSLTAASTLKEKAFNFDEETDWGKETKLFRRAMIDVTTDLGALSAQQTVKEPT